MTLNPKSKIQNRQGPAQCAGESRQSHKVSQKGKEKTMNRKIVCLALGILSVFSLHVEAQQGAKIPRIGFLNAGSDTASLKGFLQEFRNLGYVEGKTS